MDYSQLDRYIDAVGAARVVEGIGPFLSEARLSAIERVVAGRLGSVHVAVERPEDPYNAAALVRTAEAMGILHVHVVGVEHGALHARRTTQGSFNWVHTRHHVELEALLTTLQERGVRLFGATMDAACALEELPVDAPFCLLFGNEARGLSAEARAACELSFRVPMVGMSESLNLSVSAAISMYVTSAARRRFLGQPSDLDPQAALREKARYYARSVDMRLLQAL
ncbi:MAG TPA: RNA methyltransferase [Polyangiales bacterium]